jgi:hypothetical protein
MLSAKQLEFNQFDLNASIDVLREWFPEISTQLEDNRTTIVKHLLPPPGLLMAGEPKLVGTFALLPDRPLLKGSLQEMTPCILGIATCVVDAVLLTLSIAGLHGANKEMVARSATASITPYIKQYRMQFIKFKDAKGVWKKAFRLFSIIGAFNKATGFKSIIKEIFSTMSLWDWLKTGILFVAQITAWFATEGVAFVAKLALTLMSAEGFIEDAVKAVICCSKEYPEEAEVAGEEEDNTSFASVNFLLAANNNYLRPGQHLSAANKRYKLIYQEDGNLVLYRQQDGKAIWHTHTDKHKAWRTYFQPDGNLVVYEADGKKLWHTGKLGGTQLVMENNGNLVVYDKNKKTVWESGTKDTIDETPISFLQAADNEFLLPGEYLSSANRAYQLRYQFDGNLVLYRRWDKRALWSSQTSGKPAWRMYFQPDGNLVVYQSEGSNAWAANKKGSKLVLQDDGNLVIYDDKGQAAWASNTLDKAPLQPWNELQAADNEFLEPGQQLQSPNGQYELKFQKDGNLVLYSKQEVYPLWHTGTSNSKAHRLRMQSDGNLVISNEEGKPVWNAATHNKNARKLVLQNDGNLVIYSDNGQAVWHTFTGGKPQPKPVYEHNKPVQLLNHAFGRRLSVEQGRVRLAPQKDDAGELWKLVPVTDDSRFANIVCKKTGQVLTVGASGNVRLDNFTADESQYWQPVMQADGLMQLVHKQTGAVLGSNNEGSTSMSGIGNTDVHRWQVTVVLQEQEAASMAAITV